MTPAGAAPEARANGAGTLVCALGLGLATVEISAGHQPKGGRNAVIPAVQMICAGRPVSPGSHPGSTPPYEIAPTHAQAQRVQEHRQHDQRRGDGQHLVKRIKLVNGELTAPRIERAQFAGELRER